MKRRGGHHGNRGCGADGHGLEASRGLPEGISGFGISELETLISVVRWEESLRILIPVRKSFSIMKSSSR